MYLSEKPRPIDLADREMMIEVVSNETLTPHPHHHPHHHHHHHHPPHHSQMILGDSSGGDEEPEPEHPEHPEPKAPKKRAETWIAEETRSLISFRKEVDSLFNTSKSNKHLWEQISAKMREKGFDRSPTMCTDKWRNLLKEFKKARHQQDKGGGNSNSGNGKMSYYKELEELLRSRNRNSSSTCNSNNNNNNNNNNNVGGGGYHQNSTQGHPKVDAFIQFSDKGFDDASIQFGPIEAGGRSTVNLERRLEHDGDPLAITAADTVAPNGVPPWNWRDASANGEDPSNYGGKVISVKLGEYSRRIGIDGTADAIKEAIKSAFRLRTKRAFWLEDENNVVRSLDRDMPIGNYALHLDEGITIKICLYDGSDRMPVHTEEKTLYTEDDFRDFLGRRGYIGLREVNSYRSIDCLDDLHSGAMYEGVRLLGE